jgi:alginate O-acetyltransferase complex protein AlgI
MAGLNAGRMQIPKLPPTAFRQAVTEYLWALQPDAVGDYTDASRQHTPGRMIFNTISYYLLFLIPAALAFRFARPNWRPWICSFSGCAFFVFFSLTSVGGVPGAICLTVFVWEAIFSRLYRKGSAFCWVGLAQSIVFLVVFKYWNFLTGLIYGQLRNPWHWSGAFLPLGISFFTFEFIHYAMDRYRGKTEAGSAIEYMSFILYFPTMVAGPIKRYQDFLPKLRNPETAMSRDWQRGWTRILVGLAKKFAVADVMTAFTNHLNRADILAASRWVLPVWVLAYGVKIYFDFSGYSDIAIGSARLFGIKVPENFDWPYLRTNISTFWRHWHISLSSWLMDYVFIPLGGSRVEPLRVYANLMVTMLVSGLWHGAGLNFLVWGAWHGVLLMAHRAWNQWRQPVATLSLPRASLCTAGTLLWVTAGWAFFCMDLPTAALYFRRLLLG